MCHRSFRVPWLQSVFLACLLYSIAVTLYLDDETFKDELVPGFCAPSQAGINEFLGNYVAAAEIRLRCTKTLEAILSLVCEVVLVWSNICCVRWRLNLEHRRDDGATDRLSVVWSRAPEQTGEKKWPGDLFIARQPVAHAESKLCHAHCLHTWTTSKACFNSIEQWSSLFELVWMSNSQTFIIASHIKVHRHLTA